MNDLLPPRTKGFLLVILAAILWGTTGTSQGLAPENMSSSVIGALRILLGGFILLCYALYKKSFSKNEKWPPLLTLYGMLSVAGYQLAFFYGVKYAGVSIGTMVGIGSGPISAGILAMIFYKETITRRWMLSTCIAICGLALLTYGSKSGAINYSLLGILLSIGAGFFYASYTMVSKVLLDKNNPNAVMAVLFMGGALVLLPVLFFHDTSSLMTVRGIAVVVHLGVFATALSYFFYARGLKLIKVSETATLSLAEPLTATLLGILILKEKLGIISLSGIFLIFAGLCVLSLPAAKKV